MFVGNPFTSPQVANETWKDVGRRCDENIKRKEKAEKRRKRLFGDVCKRRRMIAVTQSTQYVLSFLRASLVQSGHGIGRQIQSKLAACARACVLCAVF